MRLATMILFGAICLVIPDVRADEAFVKVMVDGHQGYIVLAEHASKQNSLVRDQLAGILTQDQYRQISFWTPAIEQATEAEKTVRKFIRECMAKPKLAFPEIEHWTKTNPHALSQANREIALVNKDYDKYVRQFVGILVGGKKRIYCSYFFAESASQFGLDPSKTFLSINDGGHTVWQIEYDIRSKSCLNLVINGPWDYDR